MIPETASQQTLRSSLDRLARTGERHMRGCRVPTKQRTRAAALGLYDRQLRLHDRLVTADEFIQRPLGDGFVAAAVEDATRHVANAEQVELEKFEIERIARSQLLKWILGSAAALILIVALIWFLNRAAPTPSEKGALATLGAGPGTTVGPSNTDERGSDSAKRAELRPMEKMTSTRSTGEPADVTPDRADAAQSQASMSKTGQSAKAQPSNASSSSSGSPSDKASPNEGKSDEQKGAEQSSRASSDSPGGESQKMTAEQRQQANNMTGEDSDKESGANQEQAAGANAANQQSSARNESSKSDGEKNEGQKGAAGSPGQQQSAQKDNKSGAEGASANPGASNNQSQGKGQGNSKDALKKSRGVASMILGVPIPDRVRGLPNPGLVRTVQKKTIPKQEQVSAVDAENRGERTNPLGTIDHPPLTPWMKDLVRDYFSQDSSNEGKP